MSSPRVLLIDIETLPSLGWVWEHYEADVLWYEREWELASFAWKELGRGKVQCLARPDFKDDTDEGLVCATREVIEKADVLIAHNGDRFDTLKLNAKFVQYGMKPLSYKTIDTRKIARSRFKFSSNKLDDLAQRLGIGRKIQTGGLELWRQCIAGNPAAWRKMVRYNKWDVVLLERVYNRLRAWYPQHVNFALYSGEGDRPECPVCESTKVERRGYRVMVARRAARFACQKCGHWFSRPISKAERDTA